MRGDCSEKFQNETATLILFINNKLVIVKHVAL